MRRFWVRLAIVMLVLGSAHYYVWSRFVHAPHWPAPWSTLGTIAIILLAPSVPVAAILMRRMSREAARPVLWFAYTWFGLAVYLLLAAAISHLVVTVAPVGVRAAAIGGIAAAVAVVAYGLVHVRLGPTVKRVRLPLETLPASAAGFTIVQLTDIHIGPSLGRAFATKLTDRVNALEPDLIVLTGDLVDGRVAELAPEVAPLAGLRAKHGVFAVTGNHEYYWNADAWIAHFTSLGIQFLRNAHVAMPGFTLAGVDDSTSHAMAVGHGEDVAKAIADRDPTIPVVLLAHHPSTIARAQRAGVELQLSGHTHGGQLLPLGWIARLFEPHLAGLARFGPTWLYVSEGTGFWGPPLRVGTSCEITHLTLAATP
ncbi:MAG: metallophosphoesterase [Kofleriaceae bacterium]